MLSLTPAQYILLHWKATCGCKMCQTTFVILLSTSEVVIKMVEGNMGWLHASVRAKDQKRRSIIYSGTVTDVEIKMSLVKLVEAEKGSTYLTVALFFFCPLE